MRVIAGSARGRRLKSPDWAGLHPTGDKVKGAIFSLLDALAYRLGFDHDADEDGRERFAAARAWPRVLDLYAGSGALGIEALSRGADWADFVDADRRACRLIQANLRLTGLACRARIHPITAERAESTLPGSYDLILADPPYADVRAGDVLASIAESPCLADRAVLIWEHQRDDTPPPSLGRLRLVRTRQHGVAAVSAYTDGAHVGRVLEGVGSEHSSEGC